MVDAHSSEEAHSCDGHEEEEVCACPQHSVRVRRLQPACALSHLYFVLVPTMRDSRRQLRNATLTRLSIVARPHELINATHPIYECTAEAKYQLCYA